MALARARALGGVLVFLGAAPAEVHPAHVVPVADPVAGVAALQVLDHGHAARGSCRGREGGNRAVTPRTSLVPFAKESNGVSQATGVCTLLKVSKSCVCGGGGGGGVSLGQNLREEKDPGLCNWTEGRMY